MTLSTDPTPELGLLRAAIFAALGASGCSGGSGGSARTEIELPPQSSATQPVASTAPDRPSHAIGYVKEPNGSIHRASAVSCDTRIDQPACRGDEDHLSCKADSDCRDAASGRCIAGTGQIGTYCGCEYACATDSDCESGEACVCATEANEKHSVCVPATCKTDADCGGQVCGVSRYHNGCGNTVQLACRTADDTCHSDADCGKESRPGGQCAVGREGDGAWSCQRMNCVIGRPFLVGGAARTAPSTTGRAWTDDLLEARLAEGAACMSDVARRSLAERLVSQARLEHASVASFARASLELLALGAPPDLVRDTAAAMRDEIEHARICFSIARAYGAADTAPGPLDLAGAMPGVIDPARVAYAVAYEGCVGETLGAAEAAFEAQKAHDGALRDALATIAADEQRHAVLAWRTLAWIVETLGDDAARAARRGIDDALATWTTGDGDDEVVSLRRETARMVIAPAATQVRRAAQIRRPAEVRA